MTTSRLLPLFALVSATAIAPATAAQPVQPPRTSPEEVALIEDGAKGLSVRHFPTSLPLYTFDDDPPGVSTCKDGCATAWPPVRGGPDSKPFGDWTLVTRDDGAPQWAFKGKPLYVRYHDRPTAPSGDGVDGRWRLLQNIPKPAADAMR